ncbi:sugar isomerase domain-containing protein [Terrilactibacillus laevilacticus]|uniref:Sugar isomerase domain-containing protein n=1 Tax=Terrilactibacillus laevilacticus TaxID=1380157 RepID=A0ABW5PLA5_9BACI|nr:SIS domain-containing protein [Terrilactibacillus laevilacticus]
MSDYVNDYFNHVQQIALQVKKSQIDNINDAAHVFTEAIKNKCCIYAFGASHAGIITEELFYRTGGLAVINPILSSSLMLNTRPVTMTSQLERLAGFGKIIFSSIPAEKGDVLLIHSVSGRNPVSIDIALSAKEKGLTVIVLTNLSYSKKVNSRHTSNKKLYEVADIVIDNCGDFEDSSIKLSGLEQKIGPTSTAIGSLIVNSIVIKTADNLLKLGISPPIFHSANVDGGDAFNELLLNNYKDNIHYMM